MIHLSSTRMNTQSTTVSFFQDTLSNLSNIRNTHPITKSHNAILINSEFTSVTLINQGHGGEFRIDENGVMRFGDRVCVPDVAEIRKSILEEGHRSGLSIHPGA